MFENFHLFPDSASTLSGRVDALFLTLVGMALFFLALILAALVVFSIRYRRGPGRRARVIEGSTPLEIFWTAVPLGIVLFFFGWGAKLFYEVQTPPLEGMHFHVTGKQWMWKVQHPSGQREINSLHVPLGENVVLTMISEDVIHSFYVPAFRVKQDVLPGTYSRLWFTPARAGTYHLFCAEYCGTKHSEMIGEVVVMEPAEYQTWLDNRPAETNPVEAGGVLFQNLRCDTCHLAGPSERGPALAGRFGQEVPLADGQRARFDEAYVRESLLEPAKKISAGYQPQMPSYRGQIGEDDVLALIAYLKSLNPLDASER